MRRIELLTSCRCGTKVWYEKDSHHIRSVSATIFFLKTKGKKRGYSEKQEFDTDENLSIKVEWV